MNSALGLYYRSNSITELFSSDDQLHADKDIDKNQRKVLKAILLGCLRQLFCDLFKNKVEKSQNSLGIESYTMDNKIIQFILQDILDTGDYTLEGIANSTHLPLDLLYDVLTGINHQLSITPWAKIIEIYLQVKPQVVHNLIDKLLSLVGKNRAAFSLLINEA
jgi:hypothetical protein